MLLRQRTSLPIIFTTRCTSENGRFPMEDPGLFYTYLRKAIQWGCEYIDVELWLPEPIRQKLAFEKGNTKIISAWHDYSGTFKWTSAHAQQLFKEAAIWGDVVKMIAFINTMDDNYELEYFRSTVQGSRPQPPLSGLNMSSIGQLSRTLNKVFTPITHPLLPVIAAPGQLSAAEVVLAFVLGLCCMLTTSRSIRCFIPWARSHDSTSTQSGSLAPTGCSSRNVSTN